MALISLSEGFSLIPEGTHVFKITGVKYKEDYGKLEITMETKKGQKHVERFSLLRENGSPNEGAMNAFSYFAKVALNDFTVTEIDHEDLVGHYIECDVEHEELPSKKDPNKTVTFARLGDKRASEGWGHEDAAPETAPAPAKKAAFDLKAILG